VSEYTVVVPTERFKEEESTLMAPLPVPAGPEGPPNWATVKLKPRRNNPKDKAAKRSEERNL
jgi:hypothetical protein